MRETNGYAIKSIAASIAAQKTQWGQHVIQPEG